MLRAWLEYLRQMSQGARMYSTLPTPTDLQPWVERMWTIDADAFDGAEAPIAPDGCCEIVFHVTTPPRRWRDDAWHRQPQAFLFGQLRGPLRLHADEGVHCLGISLRAHAAAPLLRVPGTDLHSTENAFGDLGRWLKPLQVVGRHLQRSRVHGAAIASLRALARESRAFDPLVIEACDALRTVRDEPAIAALARRLNVTSRTLERRFLAGVGLSPKCYARIQRMQQAMRMLGSPATGLAGIAQDLGYADQAHFTREIVELTGRAPGDIARAAR